MSVNNATLDLITESEGFVDHWYPDPALGWKVPTCMYGHTNATGNPPFYSSTADRKLKFTKQEARNVLALDLKDVEKTVLSKVTVPLNENQFGALVSFTFNLGGGNFAKSTLLKKVNAKDWSGAALEFKKWNKAGGKVLPGLTKRRAAEAALFLKPVAKAAVEPSLPQPDDPGVQQEPQMATNLGTVVADVKSAWVSKLNWTMGLGVIFNVFMLFGHPVPEDIQAAVLTLGNSAVLVVGFIIRTFFTTSISAPSAKKM